MEGSERLLNRCPPEDVIAFSKKLGEEWEDIVETWAKFVVDWPSGAPGRLAWAHSVLGFLMCIYFLGYRRGKGESFMSSIRVAKEQMSPGDRKEIE